MSPPLHPFREVKRIERKYAKARKVLIDYHEAETAYNEKPSFAAHGRYLDACKALITLARQLAQEGAHA